MAALNREHFVMVDAWRVSLALGSLHDDAYGLVVETRGALYPLTYSRPDCSTACVLLRGACAKGPGEEKPL